MPFNQHSASELVLSVAFPCTLAAPNYGAAQPYVKESPEKARYVDAVEAELGALDEDVRARPIVALRLSGGASIMKADKMLHLVKSLKKTLAVQPRAQVAIDVEPLTVCTPSLTDWTSCGIGRVNFNAWSVIDKELSAFGALHDREQVQNAMLFMDKFHMDNVNVRLLIGLPGQKRGGLRESVLSFATLGYPHISLLPLVEVDPAKAAELPDRATRQEFYQVAREELAKQGYEEYMVGAFVAKGHPHARDVFETAQRTGAGLFGLGAGAHSRYDGFLYENVAAFNTYVNHADDFEAIMRNPRREGADVAQLRTVLGALDLLESFTAADLASACGVEAIDPAVQAWLDARVGDGLVACEGGAYSYTEEGRFARLEELGRDLRF